MNLMLFRKAEPKDLDALVEITSTSGYPLPKYAYSRERLREWLADITVLEIGGKIVGYRIMKPAPDGIELEGIEVHGGFQKKGYGSAIMRDFEEYARKRKFKRVYLRVWNGNLGAIEFYHFNGYRVIGVEKDHYSGGELAVVMLKELAP